MWMGFKKKSKKSLAPLKKQKFPIAESLPAMIPSKVK